MHEQGRTGAGERFVPGAEHLAAAPGLLEQGIALAHAAPVGTSQIGIARAQLNAKVIKCGTALDGTPLDHIQVVRAKQNARQHPAHAGRSAALAVAAKRTLAVFHAQPHVQYAPITFEPQLDLA